MKKLKLKALELGATEILTREQLKKVFGGDGGSDGSGGSGGVVMDRLMYCFDGSNPGGSSTQQWIAYSVTCAEAESQIASRCPGGNGGYGGGC